MKTHVGVVSADGHSTREPSSDEWTRIDRFIAGTVRKDGRPPTGVHYVRGVGSVFFSLPPQPGVDE